MEKVKILDSKGNVSWEFNLEGNNENILKIKEFIKRKCIEILLFLAVDNSNMSEGDAECVAEALEHEVIDVFKPEIIDFISAYANLSQDSQDEFKEIKRIFSTIIKPGWSSDIIKNTSQWQVVKQKAEKLLDILHIEKQDPFEYEDPYAILK